MPNLRELEGILPALSTPMKNDGSIDEEGMRHTLDRRNCTHLPKILG